MRRRRVCNPFAKRTVCDPLAPQAVCNCGVSRIRTPLLSFLPPLRGRGTATAVEGAFIVDFRTPLPSRQAVPPPPLGRQETSPAGNSIQCFALVTYHPSGGLHAVLCTDYMPRCAWITYRAARGFGTTGADYIPRFRADLERRIIYRRAFRPLSLAPPPLSLSRRAGASGSPRDISRGAVRKKSAFPVDKPPPFIV